jgi:hypothetical protein
MYEVSASQYIAFEIWFVLVQNIFAAMHNLSCAVKGKGKDKGGLVLDSTPPGEVIVHLGTRWS